MRSELLAPVSGTEAASLPPGFAHDYSQTELGAGIVVFEAAVAAFQKWKQFDLGWVAVANTGAPIEVGLLVAVEVRALGLWSVNLSQIVDVTRDAGAYGFIYRTTSQHIEEGEERFLLTFDSQTGSVQYELEAVSRPRHRLAKIGYPITRAFQHRFALDSHQRIREIVSTGIGRAPTGSSGKAGDERRSAN